MSYINGKRRTFSIQINFSQKKVMNKSTQLKDSSFITDYIALRDRYIEMNRLDLFLYDINILARKYNLQTNPT